MAACTDLDVSAPDPHHDTTTHYSYSPSGESTASSSSSSSASSVLSIDAPSSQSSVSPGSVDSSREEWTNENEDQYYNAGYSRRGSSDSSDGEAVITTGLSDGGVVISYAHEEDLVIASDTSFCHATQVHPIIEAVAPEVRKHPRRTQRLNSGESQDGKTTTACPRPPPSLVRQSERKDNFVDSLVDTSTQMIETIWPLSVLSCSRETTLGGKQQNLIGLRTFVQEVLRRSKTSYSTLQVALYYLILIQSCIPKLDFTMEQLEDSPSCRAMQCGRRMFLAALILASKYLQDRNFSARAWSKISGLRTCEINQNEMAFLSAVNWKLHIPELVFKRWVDIVLKYSPSAQVNTPRSYPSSVHTWKTIVPLLTPELDSLDFGSADLSDDSGYNSPGSDMSPPPIPLRGELSPCSTSNELTPTNPYTIPRTLEPTPCMTYTHKQIMPTLPRLGPLPTPQMTPQTGTFCTPAVSASGFCPGKSSMSFAMAQVDNNCRARSTLDDVHQWKNDPPTPYAPSTSARRSSLTSSMSSISSPGSMISGDSSRSSRSSSISSIASSNCALPLPRLAVEATRRCANMQLYRSKEEHQKPAIIEGGVSCKDLGAREKNPRSAVSEGLMQGVSRQKLVAKSKIDNADDVDHGGFWEKFPSSYPCTRGNPQWSSSEYPIPSEPYSASTREAAAALQDLAMYCQPPDPQPPARPRPQKGAKRPRPSSMDDFSGLETVLQNIQDIIMPSGVEAAVQDIIAPRCLDDIANEYARINEEDGKVLRDSKLADSLLGSKSENKKPALNTVDANFVNNGRGKLTMSRDGLPRKRTRAGSDRGGRDQARMEEKLIKDKMMDRRFGPGMWDGILS